MKKHNIYIYIKKIALGILPISLVATGLTVALSSCGEKQASNVVIATNKQFKDKEQEFYDGDNKFPLYKSVEQSSRATEIAHQDSIVKLWENAKAAKAELENLKINNTSLNEDEKIWLDSYITQWDIKIGNLEKGTYYLGLDPVSGGRMLSSRSNNLRTNVGNALLIYQLNEETGDPDESKLDAELIRTINGRIDSIIGYIKNLKGFLTDGMNIGIMPSNVVKKSFIKQTIETYYADDINKLLFANDTTSSITMQQLFESNPRSYFDAFLNKYKTAAKNIGFSNSEIDQKISDLANAINDFVSFYTTDYWKASQSFGYVGTTLNDLTLNKTNGTDDTTKEVEETLVVGKNDDGSDRSVYGLGYSKKEVELNNIGLGFMKVDSTIQKDLSGTAYSGNDIYNQLLYNNNSVKDDATTIYNEGIKLAKDGITKMQSIAKQVITDVFQIQNTDDWNPTISYTADPYGAKPESKALNDIIGDTNKTDYFGKFNIWLNQEDFFFGRETMNKDDLLNKYWNNTSDATINGYKNIINTQGYTKNWNNESPINGSENTVTGKYALAGAVSSLENYLTFKASTDKVFGSNFNKIADYVLSPYNYDIRKDIGVGMEGPRGSKQFQYNCDPYYSLQKWSVASLTTHEGAMGHHTQQEYWTEYMPGTENGNVIDENLTPGYSFVNDAFHEGWAVFTEWFAAELGIYGTWGNNKFDGNVLPTDWTKNTSTILNIQDTNNVSQDEINFIKNYQGGVYWNIVESIKDTSDAAVYKDDATKAVAATKLGNMLAYYGFLNEAQLRNMRMALDTAVNYKGTGGNNSLKYGASIQNERTYMKSNSGLGDGDVKSESIRYTCIPSQATGYMLGKVIINDLYTQVKTKYTKANESNSNYDFVKDSKDIIKQLFDLTLRNGEIPLNVLQEIVKAKFNL